MTALAQAKQAAGTAQVGALGALVALQNATTAYGTANKAWVAAVRDDQRAAVAAKVADRAEALVSKLSTRG